MNIYLCSTVRHLLFSLLKALSQPDQRQVIFMITDQQNIDENNFDENALPDHVEVVFIKRQSIRKKLYRGLSGNIIKLLANFNFHLPLKIQQKIAAKLFNDTLGLNVSQVQLDSASLFLFNERNKISRLFRLAFSQFSLIEEGLANYSGKPLKKSEKIIQLTNKNNRAMRYFGDDSRCKSIYLIYAEKAPEPLAEKVKQIDFLETARDIEACRSFFKLSLNNSNTSILATQPLEKTGIDLSIYKKIIKACKIQNIPVAIKPHPSEDIERYKKAFPKILLIDSKIPLELIIFGTSKKSNIFSIYSTAGIGFEKYCNRINLITDNEIEDVTKLFNLWKNDLSLINNRVQSLFTEIV